jgi:hypothetical protein
MMQEFTLKNMGKEAREHAFTIIHFTAGMILYYTTPESTPSPSSTAFAHCRRH